MAATKVFEQQVVVTSSKLSQNGDDAIELFESDGTTFSVIDTFGDASVDGSGEVWEYANSWAYRTTLSPGAFNAAQLDDQMRHRDEQAAQGPYME